MLVKSLSTFEEQVLSNPVPPSLVSKDAIEKYIETQKLSEMERANTFIVEDHPTLWMLADNCATLYNEVNFERRQAYIRYKRFKWYPKHLYEKYAPLIGSATAQQIINKNNEAWKSFYRARNNRPMITLEARISRLQSRRVLT